VIDINNLSNRYYYVACSVDDNIIKCFKIFMCMFILRYKFILLILELIVLATGSKLLRETC